MTTEEQILELFSKGDGSIKHICEKIGNIGWYTIKKVLDENGIQYVNPRKKINDYIHTQIINMVSAGNSFREISNKLDIKYGTINRHCKKNNLKPKIHSNSTNESKYIETIKELANKDESVTHISKQVGLARATVQNICKRNNVKLVDKTAVTLTEEFVIKKLDSLGYDIDLSVEIKKSRLRSTHRKCGTIRETSFWDYEKHDCKRCSNNGVSKQEIEVLDWIKSLGFEAEKIKTKGKEIDIFIPILNLGIEYCGLYWHSDASPKPKDRKYHYDKMQLANSKGIRLITIFEDEWKDRQAQVKNFLKSVMGINKKRIFARKCKMKEVDKKIARDFLQANHIQGKSMIQAAFGLYYNDELVGLVTGSKHHRQGQNGFILNRLVFEDGVQVIGGSSKLLKYLIKYAKENGFTTLISWSDNRWSEGNVYEKIGFELEDHLGPDYSYTKGCGMRYSKQAHKKKCLLEKGAVGSMENTEYELAATLGLHRVWDCGKKRWSINLN